MLPLLSSPDSERPLEAEDYEWAEFNLPPALRNAGDVVDDSGVPGPGEPGRG